MLQQVQQILVAVVEGGVLTSTPEGNGAQGGSGIVVIRYKFQ
jgi:hypothetical protein